MVFLIIIGVIIFIYAIVSSSRRAKTINRNFEQQLQYLSRARKTGLIGTIIATVMLLWSLVIFAFGNGEGWTLLIIGMLALFIFLIRFCHFDISLLKFRKMTPIQFEIYRKQLQAEEKKEEADYQRAATLMRIQKLLGGF